MSVLALRRTVIRPGPTQRKPTFLPLLVYGTLSTTTTRLGTCLAVRLKRMTDLILSSSSPERAYQRL